MLYEDNDVSPQFYFCCKKSLSSKPTVSLKPAANVAIRKSVCSQSAVSQPVNGVKLATTCSVCRRPIVTSVTEL